MAKQNQKVTPLFNREDLILGRLDDLKDGQRKLDERIDRLDTRIDRLDTRIDKLDARIDKLDARIDKLETELHNLSRHGQIMTASVVGIALAVIYFVFTH